MLILRNGHIPCHYFWYFYTYFKMVICTMLILRNTLCLVTLFLPHVARLHIACQLYEIVMNNLGVRSPIHFYNKDLILLTPSEI